MKAIAVYPGQKNSVHLEEIRKPEVTDIPHDKGILVKVLKVGVDATYVGFDIPDEFVVGYGLDYDGYYRNYPAVATLRPEAR